MNKTTYHVSHMDCSSEEQLIRMHLEKVQDIYELRVDLTHRRLEVFHEVDLEDLDRILQSTGLGAERVHTEQEAELPSEEDSNRTPLRWALLINALLFVGELIAGLLSGSMGLVADSLDMLADAFVYALSLLAIGGSARRKQRLAASSGYLQLALAAFGLVEVVRRIGMTHAEPESLTMIVMSVVALGANVVTLVILRGTQRGEAHIEASWVFTSNDIKVNALVIGAGVLVWWSSSQLPDLIAGGLIFLIVARGALRILRLSRAR